MRRLSKVDGVQISALLLIAASVQASDIRGLEFTAPQVKGTSNVYSPLTGDIVYDYNTTLFYGFDHTGTWQPLGAGAGASTPVGVISAFAGTSAPSGYLLCDGDAVSRTTYSNLFAVIGTAYGSGDGSTTFNLPNAKGVFLRGAGSQTISGVPYSGVLGASQVDEFQGHYHSVNDPGHNHFVDGAPGGGEWGNWGQFGSAFIGNIGPMRNSTTVPTNLTVRSPITNGSNGTPRVGSETRPANIGVNYIIKY